MDDLLRDFLTETAESIAQVDVEMVKLEQNPNDPNCSAAFSVWSIPLKAHAVFWAATARKVAHAG